MNHGVFSINIGTSATGHLGDYTITKDPTRSDNDARRILLDPFTVYNAENVEAAAR